MDGSLKKQTILGLIWSFVERFSTQGVQFVFSFVIARQLMPSDYGLIAMLSIFIALAQSFVDSGFSNALIQKQNRTNLDFSTVFYFNIGIEICLYFLLVASSSIIANFYNQPLLKEIIVWVALNFVINSFGIVHRAILVINLDFKRQAYISLVSILLSGIYAIWMAYKGYGVWTLVYQGLLNNLLNTVLLWLFVSWKPLLKFSFQSFRELSGFGTKLLISGVLHTIYINLYTLIIGKLFDSRSLGLYNRAMTLTQFPSVNITNILTKVTYPIECRLQNDDEKLQEKFYLFIRLTAYVIFPLMIGLSVLAKPFIYVVLTEKWKESIPYIQILCLAYMWIPIMRMNWELLNAKHRSDYSLQSEVVKKIVAFVVLFCSIGGGVVLMCWGLVLYSFVDIFIITCYTKRVIPQVSFFEEMKVLFPIFLQSVAMGGVVCLVNFFIVSYFMQLLIGIIVGVMTYILLSLITKNEELKYIYLLVKKRD